MTQLSMFPHTYFDGETYEPVRDQKRLSGQLLRVYEAMKDGNWHTIMELAERAHGSPQSISARIRDLRKDRFGAHDVERKRDSVREGVWLYRLNT